MKEKDKDGKVKYVKGYTYKAMKRQTCKRM